MTAGQQTLQNSLKKSSQYISKPAIQNIHNTLPKLTPPQPQNSAFNYTKWNTFIKQTSGLEALEARKNYTESTANYRICSAIAAKELQETEYITDAFPLTIQGNPSSKLQSKVKELILETVTRYPLTVLLSEWLSNLYICDKNGVKEITGRKTSGFYHPEEHWIAISRDSADTNTDFWPVSKTHAQQNYERSVVIHELGHALHYMFGLQTEGSETADNRNCSVQESTLNLHQEPLQSDWQYTFAYHCAKAYGLLLDNTYNSLYFNNYQRKTIEEMFAEGFNAYITAPRYLSNLQPLLYTIINRYCQR